MNSVLSPYCGQRQERQEGVEPGLHVCAQYRTAGPLAEPFAGVVGAPRCKSFQP